MRRRLKLYSTRGTQQINSPKLVRSHGCLSRNTRGMETAIQAMSIGMASITLQLPGILQQPARHTSLSFRTQRSTWKPFKRNVSIRLRERLRFDVATNPKQSSVPVPQHQLQDASTNQRLAIVHATKGLLLRQLWKTPTLTRVRTTRLILVF